MKITLHIGAHRTGSTSLQAYLRSNAQNLAKQGIGFWGPLRMRRGQLYGVLPKPHMVHPKRHLERAQGRIALKIARTRKCGISQIIASEENILGTMGGNLAAASLYPDAGTRVARHVAAFGGKISAISLNIRSLDCYWASVLTFSVPRGHMVPEASKVARLVQQTRDWRDVIADVAAGAPGIPLFVSPFERMASQPNVLLEQITGSVLPQVPSVIWRNARPSTTELLKLALSREEKAQLTAQSRNERWHPLTTDQDLHLRERYADDIYWLRAGADGLATYIEGHESLHAETHPQHRSSARGQHHDTGYELARPG